ncbi:DUF2332 domain-containing protein [Streptomyces mobaraensis NBRC 13819 = DSM 40847]|uniref:DUF2332 domain-containing protein n=1 Tax=Streptomyces mobaraensis (strain ATCC 29032 / DSM 40847 / JCM 4168 / NBRC 13819 / NCIMB 11159 / IPCR 16-22) TaxID=1223523 RepID=M3C4N1_STRM1|nr:DUF2332 domain-containing protein [Streptomyces mobaraensis]EME98905.1 hypothetical protein H340_18958 [Streptomyces mobaraensis NBRC 13819 = DSM 40847]QTT75457.1 DUF2332 domain-containing protein [Streptomyces mobaraensis NBRC 13819 = DSM 40847]
MTRARTADLLDTQARACAEMDSPLYATLLTRAAQDVRDGGPCADAVAPLEGAPGPAAVGLRLMGAVHALVLLGEAPDLAAHYSTAGGTADDPDAAWEPFRRAVADHPEHITAWMRRPPQTNEVGRANMLISGLLVTVTALATPEPPPVRLLELGTSGGLNLRADRFRVTAGDPATPRFSWGDPDSPVVLDGAWRDGTPPPRIADAAARVPALDVVERLGCDVDPLDPLDPADALALRAYVWPDHPARPTRLSGAIDLARRLPARVLGQAAADFLAGTDLRPGTLTVVWHSVMRQYVPPAEWARVETELARLRTAATGPQTGWFAHLAFEPRRIGDTHRFVLTARLGDGPEEVLAEAHPWGLDARACEVTSLTP